MDTSPNPTLAEVAGHVRSAMDAGGVSVPELARRTGIAESTIRRRLTGRTDFGLIELLRIASALATNVRDFLPVHMPDGLVSA